MLAARYLRTLDRVTQFIFHSVLFPSAANKGLNQLLCKTQILGEAGSGQAAAEPRPQIFFPKKRFSITHTSDKQRGKYICNYQKIFAPLVYVTAATSPVSRNNLPVSARASLFSIFYLFPCAFSCCLSLRLNLHSRLDGDMRGGQLGAAPAAERGVNEPSRNCTSTYRV